MSLLESISYFVSSLLLWVYLLALRAGTTFRQAYVVSTSRGRAPESDQKRTILLLGDGLAEGVGDGLAYGGLSCRLHALLRKHRAETGVKFQWDVVTLGKLHTTSRDWLPVQDGQTGGPSSRDVSNRFANALVSGPFGHAPIVVIMLGSHENMEDSSETVSNVAQIAHAAARLGKHVLVAGLPCFDSVTSGDVASAHRQNKAMEEALEALSAPSDGDSYGSVYFGPDLQKVLIRSGDVVRVENTFTSLNPAGFRAFSRDLHDDVVPLCKRVEWSYWKTRLSKPSSS